MPRYGPGRCLAILLGLAILIAALLSTACRGPAGPQGVTATTTGVNIKVVSVSIPIDRKPVVTFKLTDSKGNPIRIEDLDGTPPMPTFMLAKLVEANGYSHYENYLSRTVTGTTYILDGKQQNPLQGVITQPAADSGGKVALKRAGEYTYTFGQTIPQEAYAANATHIIGAYVTRDARAYVSNDVFTFVPSGGEPKTTRQISSTKACNQCHDPLQAHGGTRRELGVCITCHTPQLIDPETGNTGDMKIMVHRIHDGRNLPSVKSGKPYIIVGNRQSVFNLGEIGWPQDIRNCTTCHQDAPQADNWKTKPSAAVCGSCHDDIDFKNGTNHKGGKQADDKNCAACHIPDGAEFGSSVSGAHVIPEASSQVSSLKAEILKVSNTAPGQKPVIVFSLKDAKGNVIEPATFSSLSVTMAHPTTDYAHRTTETIRRAGTPGTATAPATPDLPSKAVKLDDGNFSYTLETAVDPTWTGSLAIGMEGYRSVTISRKTEKDTTVREVFYNPVVYASVTDARPVARRTIVKRENCNSCHQDLGNPAGFSVHGGIRRNPDYCVLCHNVNATDEAARPADKGNPESIQLKYMIHSLHKGEERAVPVDFYGRSIAHSQEVLYPGDLRNCGKCHDGQSYQVPVPNGALATKITLKGTPVKILPPITATCVGCHAGAASTGHYELNTTASGVETCAVCHGQTADFGMDKVHKR